MRTLLVPVLIGMLAFGTAGAVSATPARTAGGSSPGSVYLGSLLTSDGRFAGASSAATAVDMAGWQLTSNLAAGEAPRFARTTTASPDAIEAAAWSALGSNGGGNGALNGYVTAMAVYNGDLYIGGGFQNAAGTATADFIARWNGSAWSGVGSNGAGNGALNGAVKAMALFGGSLFVGGAFTNAAGVATADYLARWNGSAWSGFGSNGAGNGAFNGQVFAIAATEEDMYVGGAFQNASGNMAADYAARWSGAAWGAVDGSTTTAPFTSNVWSIAVYDQAVYFGGTFINGGGVAEADWLVKWTGASWSALGSKGAGIGALNGTVMAIVANGPLVYIGGQFTNAAGIAKADYIARWDGAAWHSLGSNGAGNGALNAYVDTLTLSNSYLYVGGDFSNVANHSDADKLARWNGSSWFALPANGGGPAFGAAVYTTLVKDGVLYVGSSMLNASAIATADFVAAYGPLTEPTIRPDGLIKKGSAGTLVGGNIYNLSAANQSLVAHRAANTTTTFYIVAQNDSSVSDNFVLRQFFTSATGFTVRYYRGTTEITSAVAAGTYMTASVAPGSSVTIKAVVKIGSTSVAGSGTTRLIRISSFRDAAHVDAVSFAVIRS